MKKLFIGLILWGLIFAASGCNTSTVAIERPREAVTLADGSTVVAYMTGENATYYLFGFIPFFTTNPNRPNTRDYEFFSDRLSEIRNADMLTKFAKRLEADRAVDIQHKRESYGAWSLWIVNPVFITSTATAVKDPK